LDPCPDLRMQARGRPGSAANGARGLAEALRSPESRATPGAEHNVIFRFWERYQ